MEWLLTIIGDNEVLGDDGYPTSSIEYEHQLIFDSIEDVINFIELNESHTVIRNTYKLETL